MIVITLFSVIIGSNITEVYSTDLGEATEYNTTLSYAVADIENTFALDEFTGAMTILTGVIIISLLVGINIFGTGLSDNTVKTLTVIISHFGLWSMFSIISIDFITAIEIVGTFTYIVLTLMFALGVIQKISLGG